MAVSEDTCSNITTALSLEDAFPGFTESFLHFLVALNILIILLAVVGNGIVVYGVRVYNVAIVADRTSMIFLENLALADMLIAVVFYLPITLTLVSRTWILGEGLCFFNAFFTSTPSIAEIWLLMAISVYRIYLVRNPFRSRHVKRRYVYSILGLIWLLALIPPFVWIALGSCAYYDPASLSCLSSVYVEHASLAMLGAILLVAFPLMVVVVCNVYLLYVSVAHQKRMGSDFSMVAILTISVICWTFIISWVPFVVKVMLPSPTEPWLNVLQIEMLGLNVTLNPLIYTITNKKFREFLISHVLRLRPSLRSVALSNSASTKERPHQMSTITSPRLSVLSNPRTSLDLGPGMGHRPSSSALEKVPEVMT